MGLFTPPSPENVPCDAELHASIDGAGSQTPAAAGDLRDHPQGELWTAGEGVFASSAGLPMIPGFAIEKRIGEGGMGVVYLATQTRLNRVCALKMFHPRSSISQESIKRFANEARVIAQIQHPNIVQIFNFGDFEGQLFLELEYVPGRSLDAMILGKPWPAAKAADLTETIALALHSVHGHGIIHRDIKPANILVNYEGVPKLSDFGLAKQLNSQDAMTLSGDLVGTPEYMAPEQARGEIGEVGPATDVHAIGAVFYELLTGRRPYMGLMISDAIMAIVMSEPIAPTRLNPSVPKDLETICLKCLEKVPGSRYASALELAEDLARFRKNEPIRARPVSALEKTLRWCRRNTLAAASLAGLALVVILAFLAVSYQYWKADANRIKAENLELQARRRQRDAEFQSAVLGMENGLATARAGKIPQGMIAMAESYLAVPPVSPDQPLADAVKTRQLQEFLSANLSAWDRRLLPLDRVIDLPAPPKQIVCYEPYDSGNRPTNAASADDATSASPTATPMPMPIPIVAVGCKDGNILILDARTFAPVCPALNHGKALESIALSPDGTVLASSGGEVVKLWKIPDGTPFGQPISSKVANSLLAFHPQSRYLAVATGVVTCEIVSIQNPNEPSRKIIDNRTIRNIVINEDVVVIGNGVELTFYGLSDGLAVSVPEELAANENGILAFHPWDHAIVIGGGRGRGVSPGAGLRIFDWRSRQFVGKTIESLPDLETLQIAPDGETWVAGSLHGALQFVNYRDRESRIMTRAHSDRITKLVYSPDGLIAASSSADGTTRFWSARNGRAFPPILEHQGPPVDAGFLHNGQCYVTAESEGKLRVWNLSALTPQAKVIRAPQPILDFALQPQGNLLAAARADGKISLHDIDTGNQVGAYLELGLPNPVRFLDFSWDGRFLIGGGDSWDVHVWSVKDGVEAVFPAPQTDWSNQGRFLPDGNAFLLGDRGGVGRLWKLAPLPKNGRNDPPWQYRAVTADKPLDQRIDPGDHRIVETGITADGRFAVTGDASGVLGFWDVRANAPLIPPRDYGDKIQQILMHPESPAVYAVIDGRVRLFEIAENGVAESSLSFGEHVKSAWIRPENEELFTCHYNRTVRRRDLKTHEESGNPLVHENIVIAVDFHPSRNMAVTTDNARVVRFWDLRAAMQVGPALEPPIAPLPGIPEKTLLKFSADGRHVLVLNNSDIIVYATDFRTDWSRENIPGRLRRLSQYVNADVRKEEREVDATSSSVAAAPDPLRTREWHGRMAEWSMGENAPYSALWHLDRIVMRPDPSADRQPQTSPGATLDVPRADGIARNVALRKYAAIMALILQNNPAPNDPLAAEFRAVCKTVNAAFSPEEHNDIHGNAIADLISRKASAWIRMIVQSVPEPIPTNRNWIFGVIGDLLSRDDLSRRTLQPYLRRMTQYAPTLETVWAIQTALMTKNMFGENFQLSRWYELLYIPVNERNFWLVSLKSVVSARLLKPGPQIGEYLWNMRSRVPPIRMEALNNEAFLPVVLDAMTVQVLSYPTTRQASVAANALARCRQSGGNRKNAVTTWKMVLLEILYRVELREFDRAESLLGALSVVNHPEMRPFFPTLEYYVETRKMLGGFAPQDREQSLDRLRMCQKALRLIPDLNVKLIGEVLLHDVAGFRGLKRAPENAGPVPRNPLIPVNLMQTRR